MSKPRLCFSVVGELLRGQQYSFEGDQPITIGRTPDNMLALDHKSVSRLHARGEPHGAGFVLVDLGSHNGTRVGDKLISKHALQPGQVVGFGEILVKFTLADDTATQGAGDNLPVVATAAPQAGALARPMTFEDVFSPGAAPFEPPKARRNLWPVLYALIMVLVVVLGLTTFWAVGQRQVGPPRRDVLLSAGETLPVDLSRLPAPDNKGWVRGLSRIESIRMPTDQSVADAQATPFRGFVFVRGKSPGTTDIVVVGPPLGTVILRVVVRGVKPPSEPTDWTTKPVSLRLAYAEGIIRKAKDVIITGGSLNPQTWKLVRELELAAKLLDPIPGKVNDANWASQMAHDLRRALSKRFEELAREIDILREKGDYRNALVKALELKNLFQDPETVEYYVVNSFYESLADEAARAERQAQEKR